MVRGYRTCAWVLALTFLIGTAVTSVPATGTGQCQKCRPGCPMHTAGRLGCHHASEMGCHHGREPGLRCACGNHSDSPTAPLPVWRAILAPSTAPGVTVTQAPLVSSIHAFSTQFVREPPTHPPRASAV